jgi:adenylate cyclase
MKRKLTTILAADVVGYSRLMSEDEDGTLHALKALRKELVAPLIREHGGRVVKLMGDGLLAEFGSVVQGVNCAVAIQRGAAERNRDVDPQRQIRLRIGINLGDVIIEGSDIYGDGVNVAARLEGLAAPGGICISDTVHRHVRSKLGLAFEDRGAQRVKNIAEPIQVFAIALADSAPPPEPASGQAPTGSDKPSIAVLPFTNMSGDPEQEYFSDGLVEDIITTLSKLAGLRVIARNSSFVYKGRTVDIRQVAKELGVQYVLEGSVRHAGNRIRITEQLIDASSGSHIWAERYDRAIDDIFAV